MPAIAVTLADLLTDASPARVVAEALTQQEKGKLEAQIRATPGLSWTVLQDDIGRALGEMLDVDVVDVFCGAWAKLDELQDYLDPQKHPPNESSRVPLRACTIKSTHHPTIEILIGEQCIRRLEFDLVLVLELDAFILRVQDGRIWEITPGEFQGSGRLLLRGVEFARMASRKHRLAGKLEFEKGIPIPRL